MKRCLKLQAIAPAQFKYTQYRLQGSTWRGKYNHSGKTFYTGPYTSEVGAALAVSRLIYKLTGNNERLQVDLDAEQRRWLQEHTLKELQAQFRHNALKAVGRTGHTSKYLGVSANANAKWVAMFSPKIRGKCVRVLQKQFETERDAATAYDHTVLQWNGREALTNFTYSEDQLIAIGVGTKRSYRQKLAGVKSVVKPQRRVLRPVIPIEPNSDEGSAEESSDDEDSKQPPLPTAAASGLKRDAAWMDAGASASCAAPPLPRGLTVGLPTMCGTAFARLLRASSTLGTMATLPRAGVSAFASYASVQLARSQASAQAALRKRAKQSAEAE